MNRKSRFAGSLTWIALLFCAMLAPSVLAAKICREFTVYFDSGKETLNLPAQKQLDSLLQSWGKWEILAELEGHTDSLKGVEYNRLLSAARVASVRNYLEQHYTSKITLREFAQSEIKPVADNGSDAGRARNRRVVIKYVVLVDGNLQVKGAQNAEVSIPISMVGDCGVCESDFKVNYMGSDAEIASAGIGMETVDGGTLTTGGMMEVSGGCGKPMKPVLACFKYPIQNLGPEFGAWTTNRQGLWERVKDFEIRNDTMFVCIPDLVPPLISNYDCRKQLKYSFADTSGLNVAKRSLRVEVVPSRHIDFLPDSLYDVDSISKCTYKCIAKDEKSNLWVCNLPVSGIPGKIIDSDRLRKTPCLKITQYGVGKLDYKPIKFTKEIQEFKCPGKYDIVKVGYYLQDADTTLPFTQVGNRKFEARVLHYPHVLRFVSAQGQVYDRNPKSIKLTYNRRTKHKIANLKEL